MEPSPAPSSPPESTPSRAAGTGVEPSAASSLPDAVPGERRRIEGRAGRLGLYVAGPGADSGTAPMLLVHSVNAAGSAYEVRPIFEHFARTRRVYALDLPGFGSSERSDRRYDVPLYLAAIHDALDAIERDGGAAAVDALALSLAAEFLARAATERPDRFRSLALVTPTGFDRRSAKLAHGAAARRRARAPGLRLGAALQCRHPRRRLGARRSALHRTGLRCRRAAALRGARGLPGGLRALPRDPRRGRAVIP